MEPGHSPTASRSLLLHRATLSEPGAVFNDLPVTATPEAIESNETLPQLGVSPRQPPQRRRLSTLVTPQSPPPRPGHSPSGHTRGLSGWSGDGGLSHIDVPRKFGEAAEYWKFYDELSDRHDKDMIKILSDNLDILLIFAGLFSAVNTAFIILSLANLSAAPDAHIVQLLSLIAQDRVALSASDLAAPTYSPSTQDVRVNSFLSASLACSLLAAFGAVMAKQWVLHYARGTVGTLESQGRTRQRKLNGVEKYRFQNAVETLPILLQVSLIFFFVGLLDYLHSLNDTVAFVVLAFALAGVVVYTITVLMASFDPQCPFQTPVSIFMQQSYVKSRDSMWWYFGGVRGILKAKAKRKRPASGPSGGIRAHLVPAAAIALGPSAAFQQKTKIHRMANDLDEPQDQKTREKVGVRHDHRNDEQEKIDNQTACWIVETSEHKEALLSAARNIPSLRKIESTGLSTEGVAFDRLLSLFKESLATWRATSSHGNLTQSGPLDSAIVYGRALCHSIVGSSRDGEYFAYRSQDLQWPRWRKNPSGYDTNEFILMKMCVKAELSREFCLNHPRDTMPRPSAALPIYVAALLEPSVEKKDFRIEASRLDRITLVQWLISTCLNHPEFCFPSTISLCAWALGELPGLLPSPRTRIDPQFRDRWWDAYTTDCNLYPNFVKALEVYHHYERLAVAFERVSGRVPSEFAPMVRAHEYVETYTALVRTTRTIIDTGSRHQEMLNENTLELDTALRQTVLTVEHQMHALTTPEGESLRECLDMLHSELLMTMKSLRRDGVEAMLPRLDTSETDAIELAVLDEERSLALLQDSPELPSTISKALSHIREGTRYAALAIVHDHGYRWFDTEEGNIHARFKQAQLMGSLSACLGDPENFELVSGILAQLVGLEVWRTEMITTGILSGYQRRALEVLDTQPTFRRLEMYLHVWRSCREHAECSSFVESCKTAEMVPAVTGWIRRVTYRDQKNSSVPQPYVPSSLHAYVEAIRKEEGLDRTAVVELDFAFEELKKLSTTFWWTLADI